MLDIPEHLVKLTQFNFGPVLERLGGNMAIIEVLLNTFLEDSGDSAEKIKIFLQSGDTDSAQKLAHHLKGSCANLGADTLSERAAEIEAVLKAGATSVSNDLLEAFETQFTLTLNDVKRLNEDDEPQESVERESISKDRLLLRLGDLQLVVRTDLVKAKSIISELNQLVVPEGCEEVVGSIIEDFNRFKVKQVEQSIAIFIAQSNQ